MSWSRFLAVGVAFLFALVSVVHAQGTSEASKNGTVSSAPPAESARGTDSLPVIVRVLPTPRTPAELAKDSTEENRRRQLDSTDRIERIETDRSTSRVTWLLAIAGILQLIVFSVLNGLSIRHSKRSAQSSAVAAEAAQKSADVSEKAMLLGQRAWVYAKPFTVQAIFDDNPTAVVGKLGAKQRVSEYVFCAEWHNVGVTPAKNVVKHAGYEKVTTPRENGRERRPPTIMIGKPALPAEFVVPGASIRSEFYGIPITDLLDLQADKCDIFLWSQVQYEDLLSPGVVRYHNQCARLYLVFDPRDVEVTWSREIMLVMLTLAGEQNDAG